jgi:hypothetical protein
MTSAELIAALQAADPSGTTPVCIDNAEVYVVEKVPAYYDGSLERLVHDPALVGKCYSVIGARIVRSGDKVRIKALPIEGVLAEDPEAPIEMEFPDPSMAAWIEKCRQEGRAP